MRLIDCGTAWGKLSNQRPGPYYFPGREPWKIVKTACVHQRSCNYFQPGFMIWGFLPLPILSCSVLLRLFLSGFSCRGSSAPCPSRPRASAARALTTSSGAATTTRRSCCRTWAAAPATSAASGWLRPTPPTSPFPPFLRPSPARLLPPRARSRATRCRSTQRVTVSWSTSSRSPRSATSATTWL